MDSTITEPKFPAIVNFPMDESTTHLLSWMGEDYVQYIVRNLYNGFRKQDPDIQILEIKCEDMPRFETKVHPESGKITDMSVVFKMQILLKDSQDRQWRVFANAHYEGEDLHYPETSQVFAQVDIERDEPI